MASRQRDGVWRQPHEEVSFYMAQAQPGRKMNERGRSGWLRCAIPKSSVWLSSSHERMQFLRLSDGRVVATNNLVLGHKAEDYVSRVPQGEPIAQELKTKIYHPKSKEALGVLLGFLENSDDPLGELFGHEPIWKTKSGLPDKLAYGLYRRFGEELPEGTSRKYSHSGKSVRFYSPERVRHARQDRPG